LGIAEICNLGQVSYSKTIGKSGEQRSKFFYRGKGEVGRAVRNKMSIGVNWEFEVEWLFIG